MNGAESLVRTLVGGGVDVCFTNPGTSEMHFVAALDRVAEMRCVLALFEGVVTGAADGYARMAGKPASTLMHLGPGFGNGIANLHNASRAHVPIVNIIGDHATYHKRYDAPLTSDIEMLARQYSKWLRTSMTAADVAKDGAEAIAAARRAPGQIATLILPGDAAWNEGEGPAPVPAVPGPPVPASATIDRAAQILKRDGARTAVVLLGNALYGRGLIAAGRIAASTGATLFSPYSTPRIERGAGKVAVERVPYVIDQAIERLKNFRHFILVGAAPPAVFFAYPGRPSVPTPADAEMFPLARLGEDYVGALEAVADSLGAAEAPVQKPERPQVPTGAITLQGLAATVGALLPENAIVVDESITSGRGMMAASKGAPPHDWLTNTGGSIGIGMPLAIGAAIGAPGRPVLCLEADGSGMYTPQALWSMARESLDITVVVFANRAYQILKGEYANVGAGNMGPRALDMLEIGRPDLDWVALAKGMGVPATRTGSLDEFAKQLRAGLDEPGPKLIEVPL